MAKDYENMTEHNKKEIQYLEQKTHLQINAIEHLVLKASEIFGGTK